MADQMLLPALVLDGQGRIVAANKAIADCLAVEAGLLVGAELASWAVEPAKLVLFLRKGARSPREFHFRSGDGGDRYLAMSLVLRSPSGGDLLAGFDMTRYRMLEQAMLDEVARYRDMIAAASDWFWELDANRRMRIIGRRELDGKVTLQETEHQFPDAVIDRSYDPEGYAAVMAKLAAHEPIRDQIHRQLGPDGQLRYIRASGVPYFGEDGAFLGYRGISIDVTAQVAAEHALRQSEARLRRSEDHLKRAQRVAATGSVDFDVESGTAHWTDEVYRMLGVDRQSFAPSTENFLAFVHPQDRAKLAASIKAARDKGRLKPGVRPKSADYRIVRPDGEVRAIHSEVEAVFDDDGRATHLIASLRDVTELRAAEEHRHELERQLLHSQKLEALGTLAGGIAHDLNNALMPVLALSKLILEDMPEGSNGREDIETIVRSSERARDLVQRILAFGRKQEMVKGKVDLALVTRETLQMLRPTLPATVQLVERIGEVPPLLGDPGRLQQVVVNLITNAAQAIGDKIGRITVELATVANRGISLTVADNGCGMDEATAARIFEPFFTTKEVGHGTGLGLSVVHGVVADHGGQVRVTSRLGKGSRFVVTLPPAAEAPRDSAPAAAAAEMK